MHLNWLSAPGYSYFKLIASTQEAQGYSHYIMKCNANFKKEEHHLHSCNQKDMIIM